MLHELLTALEETLFMVFAAGFFSLVLGLLLAIGLIQLSTKTKSHFAFNIIYRSLSSVLETFSTLPYLALVILLIPILRKWLGTDTGIMAALVSLTLISTFPFAALCEKALRIQQQKFQDLSISLGMNPIQSLFKIYLREAYPEMGRGFGKILQQLLGYSVVAGIFGAGGFGGLLIEKGYQNYQWSYVISVLLLLVIIIQAMKYSERYWVHE